MDKIHSDSYRGVQTLSKDKGKDTCRKRVKKGQPMTRKRITKRLYICIPINEKKPGYSAFIKKEFKGAQKTQTKTTKNGKSKKGYSLNIQKYITENLTSSTNLSF